MNQPVTYRLTTALRAKQRPGSGLRARPRLGRFRRLRAALGLLLLSAAGMLGCGPAPSEAPPAAGERPASDQSMPSDRPVQPDRPGAGSPGLHFAWDAGAPLAPPRRLGAAPGFYSLTEPTMAGGEGNWRMLAVWRQAKRESRIVSLTFPRWNAFDQAHIERLDRLGERVRAPQLFRLAYRNRWCVLFQQEPEIEGAHPPIPLVSFSDDLADPRAWSPPRALPLENPVADGRWRDFWVIGDDQAMHLFFSDPAGRVWRSDTTRSRFPDGWSRPEPVLRGDFFQSAQVYRVDGQPVYLLIAEANSQWRRYQKAYVSDRLDGVWHPLAVTRIESFVSRVNVRFSGEKWTDSFSSGEILRLRDDEQMPIDLDRLGFLFQGVRYEDRDGRRPAEVPWKLGLLTRRF